MFDKYLHYEVEDWLSDDDFIHYVNEGSDSMSKVVEHFKTNKEVDNKINEARSLILTFNKVKIEAPENDLDNLFTRINKTLDAQENHSRKPAKVRRLTITRWAVGVAAAIAILFFALPLINGEKMNQYATDLGNTETIELPDASTVEINTLSSVKFNAKNWASAREVELEGEAFFSVEKGKTFSVKSKRGVVTVLGTEFNIYDREDRYEVECLEGRVSVNLEDGSSFILNGGDALILGAQEDEPRITRAIVDEIDWLNDFVEFKNTRLSDVIKEMGLYFELEVETDKDLSQINYNGFFSTKSLDSAIYQVLWPLDIEYELSDGKLIIK